MSLFRSNRKVHFFPHQQSRTFRKMRYDIADSVLTVWFADGRCYDYFNVTLDVAETFVSADSPGRFYNASIRNNYRFAEQSAHVACDD